jgi:hypothetical protein
MLNQSQIEKAYEDILVEVNVIDQLVEWDHNTIHK